MRQASPVIPAWIAGIQVRMDALDGTGGDLGQWASKSDKLEL